MSKGQGQGQVPLHWASRTKLNGGWGAQRPRFIFVTTTLCLVELGMVMPVNVDLLKCVRAQDLLAGPWPGIHTTGERRRRVFQHWRFGANFTVTHGSFGPDQMVGAWADADWPPAGAGAYSHRPWCWRPCSWADQGRVVLCAAASIYQGPS